MLLAADPVIGVNLDPIVDFGTALTFTDAFKTSRPWISHAYNTVTGVESFSGGGEVTVDEHGWPTQLNTFTNSSGQLIQQRISTLMFRDIGDKYPAGIYRAQWKGTGVVKWQFAAKKIERGVMPDGTHYALLDVTPRDAGISMRIESIDPADPIRDVHVWLPDYEGETFSGQIWTPDAEFSPFHPAFLESLEPFSVLRFMEWGDTNRSSLVNWSDRREFDDARQRGDERGVAVEYMIELANELQKDVWLNMPHQADDDFITNYATLVRDHLDPSLKVYVEYSNELWNGSFDAFKWITSKLPGGDSSQRWTITAAEIVRDFDLWSDVFSGQEDRMVRVVAGFTDVPQVTNSILSNMQGRFDAIAVGSYVTLNASDRASFSASTTADQILDRAFVNLENVTLDRVQQHSLLANQYSQNLDRQIDVLVYEGGQLLLPGTSNASYLQAIYDAQINPRMYDLYERLLVGLDQLGVDSFTHFTHVSKHTPMSTTGALRYQFEPVADAPKYLALVDAANGLFFAPTLTASPVTIVEGTDAFAIVPVDLSDPTSRPFTVEVTYSDGSALGLGADFGRVDNLVEYSMDEGQTWYVDTEVTVEPGVDGFLIRVPITDDQLVESLETFSLEVSGPAGSPSTAVVTILSDDLPSSDLESGLVAHWTFTSSNDGNVADEAPDGVVADIGKLFAGASIVDGSLKTDGKGRMRVENSTDINDGTFPRRTIGLSFTADDVLTRQVIFEEGGISRGLNIYVEGGKLFVGGWNVSVFQSGWSGTWLSTPISAGQSYHVALVLDGSTVVQPDSLVGYINGAEFGRGAGSQLWSHTDRIGIGGSNEQARFMTAPFTSISTKGLTGTIDDVRVYNRVLTDDEIVSLSNSSLGTQILSGSPEAELTFVPPIVSRTDLNRDGITSAADALVVINLLARNGYSDDFDVNSDGKLTAADALEVIVAVNSSPIPVSDIELDSSVAAEAGTKRLFSQDDVKRRDLALMELFADPPLTLF